MSHFSDSNESIRKIWNEENSRFLFKKKKRTENFFYKNVTEIYFEVDKDFENPRFFYQKITFKNFFSV